MTSVLSKVRLVVEGKLDRLRDRLAVGLAHLRHDGVGYHDVSRVAARNGHDVLQPVVFSGLDDVAQRGKHQQGEALEHRLSKLSLNKAIELLGYPPLVHPESSASPVTLRLIRDRIEARRLAGG